MSPHIRLIQLIRVQPAYLRCRHRHQPIPHLSGGIYRHPWSQPLTWLVWHNTSMRELSGAITGPVPVTIIHHDASPCPTSQRPVALSYRPSAAVGRPCDGDTRHLYRWQDAAHQRGHPVHDISH